MRVIYRNIGPLLDALLCHCEGYPGSRTSDFDTYCRWVRAAELDAGIYYTDSPATLADQRYLASVERLQRESSNPVAAERAIAAHAEPDDLTAMSQGLDKALRDVGKHLPLHLRALQGLVPADRLLGRVRRRHPAALCATGARRIPAGDQGTGVHHPSGGADDQRPVRR